MLRVKLYRRGIDVCPDRDIGGRGAGGAIVPYRNGGGLA